MITIKERAKNLHDWILRRDGRLKYTKLESLLERELADQDSISRKEERERCIKEAIEYTCRICNPQCMPEFKKCDFDKNKCRKIALLREAMEGGEG